METKKEKGEKKTKTLHLQKPTTYFVHMKCNLKFTYTYICTNKYIYIHIKLYVYIYMCQLLFCNLGHLFCHRRNNPIENFNILNLFKRKNLIKEKLSVYFFHKINFIKKLSTFTNTNMVTHFPCNHVFVDIKEPCIFLLYFFFLFQVH